TALAVYFGHERLTVPAARAHVAPVQLALVQGERVDAPHREYLHLVALGHEGGESGELLLREVRRSRLWAVHAQHLAGAAGLARGRQRAESGEDGGELGHGRGKHSGVLSVRREGWFLACQITIATAWFARKDPSKKS